MAKNKWPVNPQTGRVEPPKEVFEANKPIPPIKPQPKPVCRIIVQTDGNGVEGKSQSLAPIRHLLSLETAELITTSPLIKVVSRVQKDKNLVFVHLNCRDEGALITLLRPVDSTNTDIPPPVHKVEDDIALIMQDIPAEDTYPNGFRCAVAASLIGDALPELHKGRISWRVDGKSTLALAFATTRDKPKPLDEAKRLLAEALRKGDKDLYTDHQKLWKKFWDASWIKIDDPQIELLWYVHNYLLASAARPEAVAPGLFGPWIVEDTSAWQGGYTMDYNFQQAFAAALSCNHPELLQPYLETIERMLPAARQCAKELFEAEGIAFPHQMFPINMWQQWHVRAAHVCETPWTVQHFWEYYEHTMDKEFLRTRGYPVIADCADFLASYVTPEGNGKFAFEPTKSPEHHGLVSGLPFNRNGTPELGFARYIFKAALEGAKILDQENQRTARWKMVLDGLPDYPRARNQLGDIFLDCETTPSERNFCPLVSFVANQRPSKRPGNHGQWMTYNCPTSLLQVWPAAQIDTDSTPDDLLTAIRTWHTAKFEGSNDPIIRHIAAARLGIPTLEQFKREIAPRLMPNGSITCMMNPIFDKDAAETIYMYRKNGIYTENFAYPLVINEMMLQSHNFVIKLFPTMNYYRKAEFHNLRARGGLLISAGMDRGFVLWANIVPTVTVICRIRLPWPPYAVSLKNINSGETVSINHEGDDIVFEAIKGKAYRLEPIVRKW
ncbi:MAG: glycosyl hydrolase family 95 catalytic domain-containing protein [Planctomycetota bacterium]